MEILIENLKSHHDSEFINEIMMINFEENLITLNNHNGGKSAIINLNNINDNMHKLLNNLNGLSSIKFYYDNDDLDNYWKISLICPDKQDLINELNKIVDKNAALLMSKDNRIAELEQLLHQQSLERDSVIIMLKDMSKLLK
jgi:hypothetical protein